MRESAIEKNLRLRLRKSGCLYYKFVSPGNAGVPDRIVVMPDGTVIFVELKTSRGNLTEVQRAQHKRLQDHRATVVTVRGKEDANTLAAIIEAMIRKKK